MNSNKKKGLMAASLIVSLLIIDQIIKLAVKLNMTLGESIHIFDWFQIEFVERNGARKQVVPQSLPYLRSRRIDMVHQKSHPAGSENGVYCSLIYDMCRCSRQYLRLVDIWSDIHCLYTLLYRGSRSFNSYSMGRRVRTNAYGQGS